MSCFSSHGFGSLVIVENYLLVLTNLLIEGLHSLLQELILGNKIVHLLIVWDIISYKVIVSLLLHTILKISNLSLVHLSILPQCIQLLILLPHLIEHVLSFNSYSFYLNLLHLLLLLTSLLVAWCSFLQKLILLYKLGHLCMHELQDTFILFYQRVLLLWILSE